MKKYLMILFFVISCLNVFFAQKQMIFSSDDSVHIKEIFDYIKEFQRTKDTQLLEKNYETSFHFLNEGIKKDNPMLWEKKFKAKIKIGIQVLYEYSKCIGLERPWFDQAKNFEETMPSCLENHLRKYPKLNYRKINPDQIVGDEKCKQQFIEYLQKETEFENNQQFLYLTSNAYAINLQRMMMDFEQNQVLDKFKFYVDTDLLEVIDDVKHREVIQKDLDLFLKLKIKAIENIKNKKH